MVLRIENPFEQMFETSKMFNFGLGRLAEPLSFSGGGVSDDEGGNITDNPPVTEELYEYNDAATFTIQRIEGNDWQAQTFTVGTVGDDENFNISKATIYCRRATAEGSGILTFAIKAVDGNGKPTGADLSTGTIDTMDISKDVYAWITVEMSSVQLNASTQYALVLRTSGSGGGVYAYVSIGNVYTGGGHTLSTDGGSSWGDISNSYDLLFKIHGNAA